MKQYASSPAKVTEEKGVRRFFKMILVVDPRKE